MMKHQEDIKSGQHSLTKNAVGQRLTRGSYTLGHNSVGHVVG
jgi:hypothetical protein